MLGCDGLVGATKLLLALSMTLGKELVFALSHRERLYKNLKDCMLLVGTD